MLEYMKKIWGSRYTTLMKWWNDEMKEINEIVKSLEDSGLSLRGGSKTIQNVAKE